MLGVFNKISYQIFMETHEDQAVECAHQTHYVLARVHECHVQTVSVKLTNTCHVGKPLTQSCEKLR